MGAEVSTPSPAGMVMNGSRIVGVIVHGREIRFPFYEPSSYPYAEMPPKLMILVATELEFKTMQSLDSWDDRVEITDIPDNLIPAGREDKIALKVFRGKHGKFSVLLCMCGRGKAASAGMVGYMCGAVPSLECIVNAGTCAKICARCLEIGDVCVPTVRTIDYMDKYYQHCMLDWDLGIQRDGHTIINTEKNLHLSPLLWEIADNAIPGLMKVFAITSDKKLESHEKIRKMEKYGIRHELGNVTYDMETTAVTEICNTFDKKCLVIRAVSDDGSNKLLDDEYKQKNRQLALDRLKLAVDQFVNKLFDCSDFSKGEVKISGTASKTGVKADVKADFVM